MEMQQLKRRKFSHILTQEDITDKFHLPPHLGNIAFPLGAQLIDVQAQVVQPVCCSDGICVLLFADSNAVQLDGRPWLLQNGEFVVSRAIGSG